MSTEIIYDERKHDYLLSHGTLHFRYCSVYQTFRQKKHTRRLNIAHQLCTRNIKIQKKRKALVKWQ